MGIEFSICYRDLLQSGDSGPLWPRLDGLRTRLVTDHIRVICPFKPLQVLKYGSNTVLVKLPSVQDVDSDYRAALVHASSSFSRSADL